MPWKGVNGLKDQIKATPKNTTIKVDVGTSVSDGGYRKTLPNEYLPELRDAGWIEGWDEPNAASPNAAARRTFTIRRGNNRP